MSGQVARFELSGGKDKMFELGATEDRHLQHLTMRVLKSWKVTSEYRKALGRVDRLHMSLRVSLFINGGITVKGITSLNKASQKHSVKRCPFLKLVRASVFALFLLPNENARANDTDSYLHS